MLSSDSGPAPISRNSSAMRTARPLVTCSSTHDCGPSATAGSISRPRIIGPGCSTSASGPRAAQPFRRELVQQDVFVQRQRRLVQPFLLHAQHDHHVGAFERLFDARRAAHAGSRHSNSRGSHIAGPHSVKRQPNLPSRCRFERATRLCRMSPTMVTCRPSSVPRRSRMVSASSSPAWDARACRRRR